MSELRVRLLPRVWRYLLMRLFRAGIGHMAKPPSLNMSSIKRCSGDNW